MGTIIISDVLLCKYELLRNSGYEGESVTETTSMPYDWLKQIPTALLQLDEIPLIGFPPPFPWEELSRGIGEVFQIQDFKIEAAPFQWRSEEELYSGMGDQLTPLICTIPSLEGTLTWVMASEDVYRLMSLLLNEEHHEHDVLENEYLQGFYSFAAYEVIHVLTKLPFGSSLSPQVQHVGSLPTEAALCADIHIKLRGKTLTGRIIISPALRKAWKEKYAERSLELPVHSKVAEKISIAVHFEVGKTTIKPTDWKKVHPGDFILLDSCTIQPDAEKGGRVTLTVNGMPFFIGKIKDGNIKILDHPLYYQEEDHTSMSSKTPDDQTDEHEDSSMDFDTGMDSEIESEEHSEQESEHEESLATDEEIEAKSEDEEENEDLKAEFTETSSMPSEAPLKIDEVPLSVVIEVGRMQMSVKKMMELQPGNMLELDVHPENGVDLVVNGKRIAKGELIKLGEALGIRILDIG